MPTIRVSATRAEVRRRIAQAVAVACGRGQDPTGAAQALQLRLGMVALSFIRQAFVEKARGGTDAAGLKWAPLASETVARRRQSAADRRAVKRARKQGGTAKSVLSARPVEILRDTGVLLNSLSPAIGAPGQVLRAEPGACVVGTNVPYAQAHHAGVPGRIPARPLWPDPADWPSSWWNQLTRAARTGLLALVDLMVRGGR